MADLSIFDDGVDIVVTLVDKNGSPYDLTAITSTIAHIRINSNDAEQITGTILEPPTAGRVKFTLDQADIFAAGALYMSVTVIGGATLRLSTTEILQLQIRDII